MDTLRTSLADALQWESAHVGLERATRGLDLDAISRSSDQLPYTIWQLVEHIRIAQKDILDFSKGEDYEPMDWPDDYWPKEKGPEKIEEWENSLEEIYADRQAMIELIKDPKRELFKPFPHGEGQDLFREAMLIIDHEAYHTGQIVLLRKFLGVWE